MNLRVLLITLLILLSGVLGCSNSPSVIKTCRVIATDSTSVWEQTKLRYRVEYDSSGAGVFVKSIDGVTQSRTAFWLFYVNNTPAMVSCEEYVPAIGDTIEWRLTQSD